MKLYLANVTKQNQIVMYRLDYLSDGTRDPRVVIPPRSTPPIPPGRQFAIEIQARSQLDSIVEQLTPYGLVGQVDMGRLPRGERVTYVFNIDQPVSKNAIVEADNHNKGVMVEDGKERRKRAAVGASNIVANTVAEQTPAGAPPIAPTGFDISIEQDEQSEAGERRIEEGIKVDLGAPAEPPRGGGRRPRRAA